MLCYICLLAYGFTLYSIYIIYCDVKYFNSNVDGKIVDVTMGSSDTGEAHITYYIYKILSNKDTLTSSTPTKYNLQINDIVRGVKIRNN